MPDRLVVAKLASALAAGLGACAFAWLTATGPLPVLCAAYAGYIGPQLVNDRAAATRRREAESGTVTFVEWLYALVASGRPVETALAGAALRGTGSELLDSSLERARRDYTLGVPLCRALERVGRDAGLSGLAELALRIERARELGRGALPVLGDLRDELRATERARVLGAASHVEGKLTLVLTLCYMPALALLVIVPLFLTLLNGLFG
jgi:Flp pilus assembly protein TadB